MIVWTRTNVKIEILIWIIYIQHLVKKSKIGWNYLLGNCHTHAGWWRERERELERRKEIRRCKFSSLSWKMQIKSFKHSRILRKDLKIYFWIDVFRLGMRSCQQIYQCSLYFFFLNPKQNAQTQEAPEK